MQARNDREGEPLMITHTTPQAISRVLRKAGYNPTWSDGGDRWHGLTCRFGGLPGQVSIRVWQYVENEEPTADDRAAAAEIAKLLTEGGYQVRYKEGDYRLQVIGKEVKP